MCAKQYYQQNQQYNQQPQMQPPQISSTPKPPAPKYKFRWSIFGICLTIVAFIYVLKQIKPSFEFEDILDYLDVCYPQKYARLACLAVICIAFLVIVKLFQSKRN